MWYMQLIFITFVTNEIINIPCVSNAYLMDISWLNQHRRMFIISFDLWTKQHQGSFKSRFSTKYMFTILAFSRSFFLTFCFKYCLAFTIFFLWCPQDFSVILHFLFYQFSESSIFFILLSRYSLVSFFFPFSGVVVRILVLPGWRHRRIVCLGDVLGRGFNIPAVTISAIEQDGIGDYTMFLYLVHFESATQKSMTQKIQFLVVETRLLLWLGYHFKMTKWYWSIRRDNLGVVANQTHDLYRWCFDRFHTLQEERLVCKILFKMRWFLRFNENRIKNLWID